MSNSELGFPGSSAGKESACNAGDPSSIPGLGRSAGEGIGYPLQYSWAALVAQLIKNLGSIPGLGRYPGERRGYPLQYSDMENSIDCIINGVAKRHDWVIFTFIFLGLERIGFTCSGAPINWGLLALWPVFGVRFFQQQQQVRHLGVFCAMTKAYHFHL